MWGQLSTTCCSNLLKQQNRELLVVVVHKQIRTMASEMVDPIDWSHPPTIVSSTPRAPRIARCKCRLQMTRLAASTGAGTRVHGHAKQTHYLWGHSAKVCLQDKNHIHNWVYFEYTVTKNMEICDLNSYTHDLINILFKLIEYNTKINESLHPSSIIYLVGVDMIEIANSILIIIETYFNTI